MTFEIYIIVKKKFFIFKEKKTKQENRSIETL